MNRIACSRCTKSVFNCEIEGPDGKQHRLPFVIRINTGQPDDTGPDIDLLDPNLRMPSFLRALQMTPMARIELCVACFAEVFGLPLVAPDEDPMLEPGVEEFQRKEGERFLDRNTPKVERFARIHARALHALHVGWGEKAVGDLPADLRPSRRRANG